MTGMLASFALYIVVSFLTLPSAKGADFIEKAGMFEKV